MRTTGLGCMRLSNVDRAQAIETIHAALDAGVRWLDTADVYGPTARDVGHNERRVREALDTYGGDTSNVIVSTKGGLTRTGARWIPNGQKKHLEAACARSLATLGHIDVYFLHVVDPKTPLATSVRALERLRRDGHVKALGLSNVTVEQLEAALEIAPITYVQMELGVTSPQGFESGVPETCRRLGVHLVASRPFGEVKGLKKIRRHEVLRTIADRHDVTPEAIALSWLYALDDDLVALPGATRPETGAAAARIVALEDDDRDALDDAFPTGVQLSTPRAERRPQDTDGDVVIVMGMPGAGKTTRAEAYANDGYVRINRDERGGTLAKLIPELERHLAAGDRRIVLDNTYATRATRNRVIEASWRHGAPARCDWVATSLEDAQINAIQRMIQRHGRLLDDAEVRALKKSEPNTFLPRVQYRYREQLEAPREDEGFAKVEVVPFERAPYGEGRAVFVDADAFLWGDGGVAIDDAVADALTAWHRAGFAVFGLAWLPQLAATPDRVDAWERQVRERLGFELRARWCPHPAGPVACWCRPPLPGLVIAHALEAGVDLGRSRLLATSAAYTTLAARVGLTRVDVDDRP
ncbi:MAG: aldo/keto reductase [Deltaproteobacteria bacterium]|jgi:aryl-alcohol dehydrogenase-like predicted oxidoreductase/adenylate kinase family enzyme